LPVVLSPAEAYTRSSASTRGKTLKEIDMQPTIVSHSEWVKARRQLLAEEKQFTRARDELSRKRRELPWERVEQDYTFDAPGGRQTLAELFGDKSQLIVYHFMLAPGWAEGCPSCSFVADHFDGAIPHLAARDVALVAVSRAPLAEIEKFKRRMGWQFPWVSSHGTSFNRDYGVTFTPEEIASGTAFYNYSTEAFPGEERPGASVFYKDARGTVFHTYSTYTRGLDILLGTYNFLDLTPKGRAEEGLSFPMAWVRHHDRYAESTINAGCACTS
jgi:predicted dithiol-disulfide oxidoreductase (DUF899 family)